jgi:hypothetical protein
MYKDFEQSKLKLSVQVKHTITQELLVWLHSMNLEPGLFHESKLPTLDGGSNFGACWNKS